MLVELRYGRQWGHVVDVLPQSAHAMVEDGRAVWPEGSAHWTAPVVEAPARVASRDDRGMPRGKRRAVR